MESMKELLKEEVKFNENLPNSYQKYLQRLKTFKVYKWFAKPSEFSPLECARRGWSNFSKDSLKCVTCSNIIYVQTKIYSDNSNKMLVDRHNQHCPWKTIVVPKQLIDIEIYDELKAYQQFCSLKNTLEKCNRLPVISDDVFQELDREQSESITLKKDKVVIDYLAATGWMYTSNDLIECSKCLRSIGLWLFKRNSNTDVSPNESQTCNGGEESEESMVLDNMISLIEIQNQSFQLVESQQNEIDNKSKKRKRDSEYSNYQDTIVKETNKILNPITEHFIWCPWRETEAQLKHWKLVNKQIVYLKGESIDDDGQVLNKSQISNEDIIQNTQVLMDKVKSAQSLLINCVSNFTLN